MVKATALTSVILVLAACTPEPGASPSAAPAGGASRTPQSPRTASAAIRGCETSTYISRASDGGGAVAAGPVAFVPQDYRFGTADALERSPDGEGWLQFKVPAFVRNGTATVTIPQDFRDVAKLTYTANAGAVIFISCGQDPQPESAFPGGFAVREPVCLPIDVSWDGGTKRAMLGFLKSC